MDSSAYSSLEHLGLPRNRISYIPVTMTELHKWARIPCNGLCRSEKELMRTLTDNGQTDERNSRQLGRLRSRMMCYRWCKGSYLDLKKTNLFGQDRKRMMISIVNQALHTHSTKKKAWWALVWYLSNVQTVVLKEVRTVIFLITGTLISGLVLRQKETIDTTIKNTEITPITWKKEKWKSRLAVVLKLRY